MPYDSDIRSAKGYKEKPEKNLQELIAEEGSNDDIIRKHGLSMIYFDPDASSEAVLAAARAAGVHDLVVHLADGYDTSVGEAGASLSAGQRQRIALARALYGDPFLVILDEPNSNLDAEGEVALSAAIQGIRDRGGIVVVIAHRSSALASVDTVLVMANGRVQAFGPKDEVLSKVFRSPAPLKVVAATERGVPA